MWQKLGVTQHTTVCKWTTLVVYLTGHISRGGTFFTILTPYSPSFIFPYSTSETSNIVQICLLVDALSFLTKMQAP